MKTLNRIFRQTEELSSHSPADSGSIGSHHCVSQWHCHHHAHGMFVCDGPADVTISADVAA
jgi:hypothetical protein